MPSALLLLFEIQSYISDAGLRPEHLITLLLPSRCWHYRCEPPCLILGVLCFYLVTLTTLTVVYVILTTGNPGHAKAQGLNGLFVC